MEHTERLRELLQAEVMAKQKVYDDFREGLKARAAASAIREVVAPICATTLR